MNNTLLEKVNSDFIIGTISNYLLDKFISKPKQNMSVTRIVYFLQ